MNEENPIDYRADELANAVINMQSQVAELTRKLAEVERKFEWGVNERNELRARLNAWESQSPAMAVLNNDGTYSIVSKKED